MTASIDYDLARLRLLLVEDNDLDARSIQRALATSPLTDFLVEHVWDFASALDRVNAAVFDVVLLDLSLPDSEGLVSIDTLVREASGTAVVVLTGLDDPETAMDAVTRGAQDYLVKSEITPSLATRSIRYAVARHHHESELRSANELLETLHDRERIARDLHDTVIQRLFAAGMTLQAVAARTPDNQVRAKVSAAVDEIDEAIRELREAIFGLQTQTTDLSLAEALSDLALSYEDSLGFVPHVRIGAVGDLPEALERDVIAVVNEATANIARHASATAAEILIEEIDGALVVNVIDNGEGLSRHFRRAETRSGESIANRVARRDQTGHGLRNMEARAQEWDGTLTVHPGPGGGVAVEWIVPVGGIGAGWNLDDRNSEG